jgi:hypothetical protein
MRMKRMTEDFPLKWLICIPNISAVRGNVVFEMLHDFYRKQYIENCFLRDSRDSREATIRNEFGKFMSYFACCLATCP